MYLPMKSYLFHTIYRFERKACRKWTTEEKGTRRSCKTNGKHTEIDCKNNTRGNIFVWLKIHKRHTLHELMSEWGSVV